MKKEIKDLWTNALRSGKFKQSRFQLKNEHGYCCLGVLCELHARETNSPSFDEHNVYHGRLNSLSNVVKEWAGMKSGLGNYDEDRPTLAHHNDELGDDFNKIADIIDKHWGNM